MWLASEWTSKQCNGMERQIVANSFNQMSSFKANPESWVILAWKLLCFYSNILQMDKLHIENPCFHCWFHSAFVNAKALQRQSTTTLKTLTSEVNNIDHVITMQYAAGKSLALAFILLWHIRCPIVCESSRTSIPKTTHWHWCQQPPPAGQCALSHYQSHWEIAQGTPRRTRGI